VRRFKTSPKWVNTKRQNVLVKLFIESGNRCLLHHKNCSILEHYLHTQYRFKTYAKAIDVKCYNSNGEAIKDKYGNQLYFTAYKSERYTESESKLVTEYELLSSEAVKYWINDDRLQKLAEWKAERKAIHSLSERNYKNGRFGSVSSVIFHESQPLYYVESVGMNALTCKPFVRVKLASSYTRLDVDLGDSLRKLSKNRKRKAIRYGKPLPSKINDIVSNRAFEAVSEYLK